MVAFPQVRHVSVAGYRLYPGVERQGVLAVDMASGPYLVLGVNGLGKSTFLLLIRHLISGAVRQRAAGPSGEGAEFFSGDTRIFSSRVSDGAREATAKVVVHIGEATLTVQRRLSDLSLIEAVSDIQGAAAVVTSEADYRLLLAGLMGVSRFEDALRLLDRVTFYLESRESLIWDAAAQFELFRAALASNISAELRRLEGEIVTADSAGRNLNAALNKVVQRRNRQHYLEQNSADTRVRLAAATAELELAQRNEQELQLSLEAADQARSDSRVEFKRAERTLTEAAHAYEEIKYEVLRHGFASLPHSEQYVLLKLVSDGWCLACDQESPEAAAEVEARRSEGRCLVCGKPRHKSDNVQFTVDAIQAKAEQAYSAVEAARKELERLADSFSSAEKSHTEADERLERARRISDSRESEVRRLRRLLPSEDRAELAREEDRVESLRREVQAFRRDREVAESTIESLIAQVRTATEAVKDSLERTFEVLARPFFAEQVRLVYSPRDARIGQTGKLFSFPAFEIEMTSGISDGAYVRRGPLQVSLSQREYLDIIFRMSVVTALGVSGGSIVVDGPEGSVDAVFAERAGDLFASFSGGANRNVLLASNVVEGGFIPRTLAAYTTDAARRDRIINLIQAGAPTPTLESLRAEYEEKIAMILAPQTVS